MIEITVTDPAYVSKKYSFEQSSVMIGRAEGNDIILESDDVSRYHARLSVIDNEKVVIQDLDSTNGVYVGGKKTAEAVVLGIDQIKIGDFSLTVTYRYEETREAPAKEDYDNEILDGYGSDVVLVKSSEGSLDEGDEIERFYWESLQAFLAPVWNYLADDKVTEILINGPKEVYIEKHGKLVRTDSFFTDDQLNAAVLNISQYVGRRVSDEEPILDARLPDGSRSAQSRTPYG